MGLPPELQRSSALTLGILAWVSGNIIFADYLNIMYLPNVGELSIYISAFVGATVGFLWYNTYPAQVFMGDTGSLAIGGIIAVFAIIIRKELLIPILCAEFSWQKALSVIMQVSLFQIHQKELVVKENAFSKCRHFTIIFRNWDILNPKLYLRFFIVGIMLAVFTIVTLKLR